MRTARGRLREILTPAPALDYLARNERCLIHTRLHWSAPLKAMFRAGVGMVAMTPILLLLTVAAPGALLPRLLLVAATLAHSGYLFWCVLRWRYETILVTDQRVIRKRGVLTSTVDSVRLDQVPDAPAAYRAVLRALSAP